MVRNGSAPEFSRRDFLGSLALFSAAFAISPVPTLAKSIREQSQSAGPFLISGNIQRLVSLSLQNRRPTYYSLPTEFYAHSFIQNPRTPHKIWAVEKWGPRCVELDLKQGRISKEIPCEAGVHYFGHGVASPDGSLIFISRVKRADGLGYLSGYDPLTAKLKVEYQVAVGGLHEVHIAGDSTAYVASSGLKIAYPISPGNGPRLEKSALVQVDLSSGRVLRKLFISEDDQLLGHFQIAQNGNVLAGSSTHSKIPGLYFCRLKENSLSRVELPEEVHNMLLGEMLSVAIDNTNAVGAFTCPAANIVIFVDMESGKYRGMESARGAKGVVALPEGKFLFTTEDLGSPIYQAKAPYSAISPWPWKGKPEKKIAFESSHIGLVTI